MLFQFIISQGKTKRSEKNKSAIPRYNGAKKRDKLRRSRDGQGKKRTGQTTYRVADFFPSFCGDSRGDRNGRDPARLRADDVHIRAPAGFDLGLEDELGQLRGLAAPSLSGNNLLKTKRSMSLFKARLDNQGPVHPSLGLRVLVESPISRLWTLRSLDSSKVVRSGRTQTLQKQPVGKHVAKAIGGFLRGPLILYQLRSPVPNASITVAAEKARFVLVSCVLVASGGAVFSG
jgi:hypothetical protein